MNPISKNRAIELLQQKIDEIPSLQSLGYSDEVFQRWEKSTATTIKNVFVNDSTHWDEFRNIRYRPSSFILDGDTPHVFHAAFQNGLRTAKATLQSMIDEIRDFWPDDAPPAPATPTLPPLDSRKVFLVHGRDIAVRDTVARFLQQLDLDPVILAECPNGGRTIIEKFEQESNVGYAIVLFTPDDIGGLQNADEQQARARQNVVFELGYFVGRLGRSRVCVLNVPAVEIPSDFFGVAYVPFNASSEEWKIGLGRELKNAGLNIDGNKAFF